MPPEPAEQELTLREAESPDGQAIARIYNEGIEDRQATFQTHLHEPGDLEQKLAERDGRLLVAERDGEVIGWAGLARYDDPAEYYSGVAEVAVYVARDARGAGVGKALLTALADLAERDGRWKLTAKLFTTNEPSIALFRSCGWREVGVHHRHGQLEGEWKDVLVLELSLSSPSA